MKNNRAFGMLKLLSTGKLVNLILLVSIILTSCGMPTQRDAEETPSHLGKKLEGWITYNHPVYDHPKPVEGERPSPAENPIQNSIEKTVNNLPIQFVENIGQFDERSLFQAQAGNQTMFITKDAIWFTLLEEKKEQNEGSASELFAFPLGENPDELAKVVNLKISIVGGNQNAKVTGLRPFDAGISYLDGESKSFLNVPAWGGVKYENIYDNFDLILSSENDGYSWQFKAKDSAGLSNEIRVKIEGAQSVVLYGEAIVLTTEVAHIVLPLPLINGKLPESARLEGNELIFISAAARIEDKDKPTNSTGGYLALPITDESLLSRLNNTETGGETNIGYVVIFPANIFFYGDISVDSNGNTYLVGQTSSPIFPTKPGSYDTTINGLSDVVVSKLTADGSGLHYSTYLGGSSGDSARAIALDNNGNAYILGYTNSTDFPGLSGPGYFLTILNEDGTGLLYSSIVLASQSGTGTRDIAVDINGNTHIAAYENCYFSTVTYTYTSCDSFVIRLDSNYFQLDSYGAVANAVNYGIAVDKNGYTYVTGSALSAFEASSNAYDTSFNGGISDVFVTKINSQSGELAYSTLIGGSSNEGAYGVALDGAGNVYIAGSTGSSDFPVFEGYDTAINGGNDAFVTKLSAIDGEIIYSTFLGGSSTDGASDIAVNLQGNAFVTGTTSSTSFPTIPQDPYLNSQEGFVTKLSTDGKQLVYSTFTGFDSNYGLYITSDDIAVDPFSNAYILGRGYAPICTDCSFDYQLQDNDSYIIKFDDYGNTVNETSVFNSCNYVGECQQSAKSNTQGVRLGPINTRTGGLYYQTSDITVPTAAKELSFFRSYSSLATDLYSSTLGYGWTHSLDTRLILPTDPGGEAGYILFKAHTANQYRYVDHGDGTYSPDAGIVGNLTYVNGEYILSYPDQATYTFDANGRLLTWQDEMGRVWEYSYTGNGQIQSVSADNGTRTLTLAYDALGRIASVTDQSGRSIAYTYDANGDLVGATSLIGGSWTYEYDSTHRLTRVIDPNGNTVERTEYDVEGRAIKQWDGNDNLLGTLVYNADGTTTITDSLGNVETHTYDDRLTLVLDEDGAGGETQKTYDGNFRPTTITDAGNAATNLVWSEDGANLTKVIDAEGGQTDITYDSLNNPTSVIDPLGYLTTYEYNGTLLTGTTNALNQATIYTYTSEGFVESITDALGNTTTYSYDSFGQRTSMTDALGNTWTYIYDSLGRMTDATDPLGRVSHSEYDLAGRLIRSVRNYDPGKSQNEDNLWNIVTEYGYDLSGNQTSVTDTFGRVSQYQYDAAGQLVKIIDPNGNETTNTYNSAGQLISTTDALGHITTYTYDAAGRLVSTVDPLNGTTSTIYNLDGTVASTTDALGRATSYTYDDLKRVLTITLPNGAVTTNSYDANGNLIATTDALGSTTHYEYDALGRVIKTIDPLGNFTENFYDDAGRLVQFKDARGNATTFAYDSAGRQISVTDALGNVTSYEYDNLGRRTAVIDAAGSRTKYTYDALDRVVAVTDPLGNAVTTEYDALGQVIRRTDANGNDASFAYNNLGQTVSQTDALGNTTSFAYDALGNRVSTMNARGAVTSVTYDALNRPVVTTDPLGYTSTTTYDIGGQVSASTNANNETTSFGYNSLGQQTAITDPLGHVTQYNYDSLGRLTLMIDANGTSTAYEYDALGRLLAVMENYKPGFQPDAEVNVRTEYTYDANGNRLTIKDGNGNITTFTYDSLNRLSTETDPLGNTWSYVYDELGRRISMTDANGETTSYEYDNANRLTGIEYADNNDVSFAYDAGGRRTSMTDGVGTTTWEYDDVNRPTAITDPFDTTVSYVYDPVGNLERMLYPDKDVQYTYDDASRLIQVNDWTKNTYYEYDPLGRILAILRPNGVNSSYSYDVAGRLILLTHGTTENELASYQYAYDNISNRIQTVEKVKTAGSGPTVHLTVVDNTGALITGREVYAFNGDTYTGYHATTDGDGQVAITLPQGDYRFRIDVEGTQYWSNPENHCTIGECDNLLVTITAPTVVYVADSSGVPQANVPVYAFMDNQYTGYHGVTDDEGVLLLRLPEGNYDLRADFIGNQFWSEDSCHVPYCWGVSIVVNQPVTVTVLDNIGMPHAGIEVYAFDGTTYTGKHATTDENGQVKLTLLNGNYRFRADFNGTQFWSDASNHCDVPGCSEATVAITLPLVVTVMDSGGAPQQGVSVYAFNGSTYTGYNSTTDADGRVTFTLPQGNYRFRADFNGTQFWSDTQNHCAIPDCSGAQITVTNSTTVTVVDTENNPKVGVNVYAFNGATYTGYHGTTDSNGQVNLTLPQGSYRFRADFNGTQFWSGASNHCDVPGCTAASVTVTNGVLVTVTDTDGAPKAGIKVYAFNGSTYTGYNATTNASGQVTMTLPVGSYRFRADFNGTQFWSGTSNHCDVPGCGSAGVTVTNPITVTVTDTDGTPKSGLKVYAFNGSTYTGSNATTNASGQVTMTLPLGNYRFRADLNGTQFWSGAGNHCTIPGCSSAAVTVSIPLTISVQTADGTPQTGVKVYAFNGTTYTGYNAITNASGQVTMTLPLGSYRFRADFNGSQYWSGTGNHCDIPGCLSLTAIVGPQPTATATFTATATPPATPTATETPLPPTTTPEATVTASPTPEETPTETPAGSGYLPDLVMVANPVRGYLLSIQPMPLLDPPNDVTVTVLDVDSTPKEGLSVYVFDETTYTGFNGATDANGQVTFTLPDGNYRFRADLNGTQFWSGETNHCAVPNCDVVDITVTKPILLTVQDSASALKEGLNVYAFDGTTYTGYHGMTDANGQVSLTLPQGNYRFRADLHPAGGTGGTQFWSGTENHCEPGVCETVSILASLPVTVTVMDTDSSPKEGLNVYAFDDTSYSGYHLTTDANGQVIFTLPFGSYRFRVDLNGTQFWSGAENHCDLNDVCDPATITVTKPLTVTIADELNTPYADLQVYAFDGDTYTGYRSTTDANGQVMLTLPEGNYRFRADLRGTQYWSATENTCALPGCENASVTIPGGFEYSEVTIDYTYDSLYRLTNANYSSGDAYQYTYDAVGNRLTQESEGSSLITYQYDAANRLASVDGVNYTFDANGNLLNDGIKTYTYDSANRLTTVDDGNGGGAEFTYNGLGDRLTETAPSPENSSLWETKNYTLDLNTGLTQVLSDGTTTYTYGLGRISQQSGTTPEYFLGDALGSVRQMTDQAGAITYVRNYDPYGVVSSTSGTSQTAYGFTGEQYGDSTQLIYLRARYYNPADGRFQSRDTWSGDYNRPLSLNRWMYVEGNPINYADPSGNSPINRCQGMSTKVAYELCIDNLYGIEPISWLKLGENVGGERGCYTGPKLYRAPGYLEGIGFWVTSWRFGGEVVYDFARMEKGNFGYFGAGGNDALDLGGGIQFYYGTVMGLPTDVDVISAYRGNDGSVSISGAAQAGLSVDLGVGVGAGVGGFISYNDPMVRGTYVYDGISLSADFLEVADIDIATSLFYYGRRKTLKSYIKGDGSVDRSSLSLDILTGIYSPTPLLNPFVAMRAYGLAMMYKYANVYEELQK